MNKDIHHKVTDFNLLSEEVQEVMGSIPPWILRWGIVLVAFVCMLLVAGSFVFSYTDKVAGEAVFATQPSVAKVTLPCDAEVKELKVKNGDAVRRGQPLFVVSRLDAASDSIIVSPISGTVNFVSTLPLPTERPFSTLLVVIPSHSLLTTATMYLRAEEAAKVAPGQRVVISIEERASEGHVNYVSRYPNDEGLFLVEISVDRCAVNSIPPSAHAEIIVRESRLIDVFE